jgi:hypothetical protein
MKPVVHFQKLKIKILLISLSISLNWINLNRQFLTFLTHGESSGLFLEVKNILSQMKSFRKNVTFSIFKQWVENNPTNIRIFIAYICKQRTQCLMVLRLWQILRMLTDVRNVGFLPPFFK